MTGGVGGGGGRVVGVWRGGMGRAGPGRGVWLGINQGTVGFLLLSCFEALCPGIPTLLYFSLLLPLTLPSRVGHLLRLTPVRSCRRHQSFGSSVEARNHADVFGAGVGCPPGNR